MSGSASDAGSEGGDAGPGTGDAAAGDRPDDRARVIAPVRDRVLVTGATGTVGSVVVEELAGTGVEVRVATRDPGSVDPGTWGDHGDRGDEDGGVEAVAFDFTDPGTYGDAFDGVEAVFLVRPPQIARVERDVFPAIDAAVAAGVEHFVVLSVLGAEKNPLLPHRRIEKHLEEVDATWSSLRASFFMQNFLEVHRHEIVEHSEILVPAGRGRTSFVDARDVGAVGARALVEAGHEGVAYDLTGPAALTYHEAAAVFSEVLGRSITYPEPSIPEFVSYGRARGYDWGFLAVMTVLYTTARLRLAGRVTDDVARVLGREPRSLSAFVADHADAFR